MKKLTLSIALLASVLATKAQDTTCTMITREKVHKFDYYSDTILRSREHTKGSVFIDIGHNQVEVIHLYDKVNRLRKIILTYDDGSQVVEICESKSNLYYASSVATGPMRIEIKRPRFMIKL